jgi:hypothetical protein
MDRAASLRQVRMVRSIPIAGERRVMRRVMRRAAAVKKTSTERHCLAPMNGT